jgi:hypothetical protein
MSKSVTLAYPYEDADGKKHKADTVLDLEVAEANRLLAAGLARLPEKSAKADANKES